MLLRSRSLVLRNVKSTATNLGSLQANRNILVNAIKKQTSRSRSVPALNLFKNSSWQIKSFASAVSDTLFFVEDEAKVEEEKQVPMVDGVKLDPWLYEKPQSQFKIPQQYKLHLNSTVPVSSYGALTKEQFQSLSAEHVGKFILLEKEDMDKYFPQKFSGEFDKMDSTLIHKGKKVGLMVREETLKIAKRLKSAQENKFSKPDEKFTMIFGVNGCGKSGIVNSVILHARLNGWIVLAVRSAKEMVEGYRIYQSERAPGLYDNPDGALPILKGFYTAHKEQLAKLPLKGEVQIPGFQKTEQTTLANLAEYGIEKDRTSCDVLFYLKNELKEVTEFPVLIVVDNINSFVNPDTAFYDPTFNHKFKTIPLDPAKFTLVDMFKDFENHGMKNGHYIVSSSHVKDKNDSFTEHYGKLIQKQRKENSSSLVEVPVWRKPEFDNFMKYLEQHSYFKRDVPGGERSYVYYLCGGVGKDIMNYSRVM